METLKPWDDERLRHDRLHRLQSAMKKEGVGALFLSEPENIQYVINVRVLASRLFVPVEGRPLAIVRPRDIGYVKEDYSDVTLAFPPDPSQPMPPGSVKFSVDLLADLMSAHRVSREPVGFDALDIRAMSSLSEAGVLVRDAHAVVDAARSVKTQDEVQIYRTLARQYLRVMAAFRTGLRPGTNEHELASMAAAAWYNVGGEDIEDLEVCSGQRMNPWHRWPTNRIVKAGEFVAIDFHGRGFGGLIGDLSRTYLVGREPRVEEEDLYLRARDYLLEATATLRAGCLLRDILESVPKVPAKFARQLYNYNIVHSVGMTFGGSPELNKATKRLDASLEPNQVLTIESYFAEEGSPLAVKLERMVVIRDGLPEVLDSDVPLDDWRVC